MVQNINLSLADTKLLTNVDDKCSIYNKGTLLLADIL